MTVLRFHDEAKAEFLEATDYYAERSPDVGDRFRATVDHALEQILQMPWAAPAWPGRPDVRRRALASFTYTIVYMVVEPVEIVVIAVAHAKRRPGYWLGRLR